MPIQSTCVNCGQRLQVDDALAGLMARCPTCDTTYTVPEKYVDPYASDNSLFETAPLPSNQPRNPLPATAVPGLSAPERSSVQEARYLVQVPDGKVYGPIDAGTLMNWAAQGRVNDTCQVRLEHSDIWVNYSVWKLQRSSQSVATALPKVRPNIFGDDFGRQEVPANQTTVPTSGQGLLVLVLGIVSWFMCFSFIGAPIIAVIAIAIGTSELRRIREGRSPSTQQGMVLLGMGLAIANLAVTALFLLLFMAAIIF